MTLEQLEAYRYNIRHPTEQGFEDAAEVEHFVNAIPDSFVRKMISARYIDGLTWSEIAAACYPNSEDSCRMIVRRYLQSVCG